jgi:hypothetical protein
MATPRVVIDKERLYLRDERILRQRVVELELVADRHRWHRPPCFFAGPMNRIQRPAEID